MTQDVEAVSVLCLRGQEKERSSESGIEGYSFWSQYNIYYFCPAFAQAFVCSTARTIGEQAESSFSRTVQTNHMASHSLEEVEHYVLPRTNILFYIILIECAPHLKIKIFLELCIQAWEYLLKPATFLKVGTMLRLDSVDRKAKVFTGQIVNKQNMLRPNSQICHTIHNCLAYVYRSPIVISSGNV